MKYMLLTALCALQITASELVVKGFASHKLGDISLIRTDKGYDILNGDKRTEVKPYDVDPLLKRLDKSKLEVFLKEGHGYTEITQLSNGDYRLKAQVRIKGGGPITGKVLYWVTKGTCYGVLAVGAAVGIATIGKDVAKHVGPEAAAVVTEVATAGTMAAGNGLTPVVKAAVEANPELKEKAIEATTVGMIVGVSKTVKVIESVSQGAQLLGNWLPLP